MSSYIFLCYSSVESIHLVEYVEKIFMNDLRYYGYFGELVGNVFDFLLWRFMENADVSWTLLSSHTSLNILLTTYFYKMLSK